MSVHALRPRPARRSYPRVHPSAPRDAVELVPCPAAHPGLRVARRPGLRVCLACLNARRVRVLCALADRSPHGDRWRRHLAEAAADGRVYGPGAGLHPDMPSVVTYGAAGPGRAALTDMTLARLVNIAEAAARRHGAVSDGPPLDEEEPA